MKKIHYLLAIGMLLLSASIFLTGCKKKYPSPEFTVTYRLLTLPYGDQGIQFFADCTTTDVRMIKVDILDPNQVGTVTYNLNGLTRNIGEIFALQDVGNGYLKESGVYRFTFSGNRAADNAGFTVLSTMSVAK